MVAKFCAGWPRWQRAAEAVANLDALAALAVAADELAAVCPDVCTPRVFPPPATDAGDTEGSKPFLRTVGLGLTLIYLSAVHLEHFLRDELGGVSVTKRQ